MLLKDRFDAALIRTIAAEVRAAHPPFDERAFLAQALDGLDDLELTARARRVADALHAHLPQDDRAAARILASSLGPELDRTDDLGFAPFRYLPHAYFVAAYGLDDFGTSMALQYELTKRFTAEFSIRPFLERYPEATLLRLRDWARDPNPHVRRLVSEGTRPRLPWAPRLRAFQEDPRLVLALLELLKDDPERYVQRSVANNLNDIAKDHPDVVAAVCRAWSVDAPPGRAWIVKHALRSLVKRGDAGALATLGVGAAPKVRIEDVRAPKRVRLGDVASFSFTLVGGGRRPQQLLVDYAVHFVKANGATRPKVFKLKRLVLAPGEAVQLEGAVSFAPMTTRRAHPGRHAVEALINGVVFPLAVIDVRR